MKSFIDRIEDERLTDNTQIAYCTQCTLCKYWGNDPNDYMSNKPTKGTCDKYSLKPMGVINNTQDCPYREVRADGDDR